MSSKIESIYIENFMSIKKASLTFDETNILNIKGYNDSGKSAILRALGVIFFNSFPRSQKKFIRHGEKFFRILVNFNDGVSILRDRYITGSSLYEIYKDKKVLFSTKVGDKLTSVQSVPLEIKEYLNLIDLGDNGFLNFRSNTDKQFLTNTSGSENLEMMNFILKIKETTLAINSIKKDINTKQNIQTSLFNEIEGIAYSLLGLEEATKEFIEYLEEEDRLLDLDIQKAKKIEKIGNLFSNYSEVNKEFIHQNPIENLGYLEDITSILLTLDKYSKLSYFEEQPTISLKYLDTLNSIYNKVKVLQDLEYLDELPKISASKLASLEKLISIFSEYAKVNVSAPVLDTIDLSKLISLKNLLNLYKNEYNVLDIYSKSNEELKVLEDEMKSIELEAKEKGITITRCDNCGNLVQAEVGHIHV